MKHITSKVNFPCCFARSDGWQPSDYFRGRPRNRSGIRADRCVHVVQVTRPDPQAAVATSEPAAAPQSPIQYFPAQFVNNAVDIAEPIEQF
jgi:hypothetical protein